MTEETKSELESEDDEQQDEKKPLPLGWKLLFITFGLFAVVLISSALWVDYSSSIWIDEKAREIAEHDEWFVLVTYYDGESDFDRNYKVWLYPDTSYSQHEVRIFLGVRSIRPEYQRLIDCATMQGGWAYNWSSKGDCEADRKPRYPDFQKGVIRTYARAVVVKFEHMPDTRGVIARCFFGGRWSDRLKPVSVRPGKSQEPTSPDD